MEYGALHTYLFTVLFRLFGVAGVDSFSVYFWGSCYYVSLYYLEFIIKN